jgi:hypothetical protein
LGILIARCVTVSFICRPELTMSQIDGYLTIFNNSGRDAPFEVDTGHYSSRRWAANEVNCELHQCQTSGNSRRFYGVLIISGLTRTGQGILLDRSGRWCLVSRVTRFS